MPDVAASLYVPTEHPQATGCAGPPAHEYPTGQGWHVAAELHSAASVALE